MADDPRVSTNTVDIPLLYNPTAEKAGDIAAGVVIGTGTFLYHSSPISKAVDTTEHLVDYIEDPDAAVAKELAKTNAIENTFKEIWFDGLAAVVERKVADGEATWNEMGLTDRTSFVTQGVWTVATFAPSLGAGAAKTGADVADAVSTGALGDAATAAENIAGKGVAEGVSTTAPANNAVQPITPQNFFEGTQYTSKVLNQAASGDYHGFPESVDAFSGDGTVRPIVGGDGITRWQLTIPGSYNGETGVFEYIRNLDGTINHRLFVPSK